MAGMAIDENAGPSCGNPYKILNIDFGASESAIAKAYRKLSLKYHPDRRRKSENGHQEKDDRMFLWITESKDFLLNSDFAERRRKYNAWLQSSKIRRENDERRIGTMSERRKRMRDELKEKEKKASDQSSHFEKSPFQTNSRTKANKSRKRGTDKNADLLNKLRKEGSELRDRHSNTRATDEMSSGFSRKDELDSLKRKRQNDESLIKGRQVRLKWSRRKTFASHSEDTLAKLLSTKFGGVESVQLIGSKGNAALITFALSTSCEPCVKYYLESDEMRASFLDQTRQRQVHEKHQVDTAIDGKSNKNTSNESIDDRRIRQASERANLLQKMLEENDGGYKGGRDKIPKSPGAKKSDFDAGRGSMSYPPPLQNEGKGLSPLQQLEKMEADVLTKCGIKLCS